METRSSLHPNMNVAFVWLNDDCIFEIFDWLSVDDLCSISRVSKRMQNLAENYFERKHFSKYLYIYCDPETLAVCVEPRTNYIARFRGFVKRVYVDGSNAKWDEAGYDRLMSYVKFNCSSNMTEIHFRNVIFHENHIDWMKGKLQKVETIEFKLCRCRSTYDILNSLLSSCGQLKHLILNETSTWIRESMKSTNIQEVFCGYSDIHVWNSIFEKCEIIPQLEQLTLSITHFPTIHKYMDHIADRATGLKKLWVDLPHFSCDALDTYEKLKHLVNSIPNMRFRFKTRSACFDMFLNLADRNITDRIESICVPLIMDSEITKLKNLKKLFISREIFTASHNNIEELYFSFVSDDYDSYGSLVGRLFNGLRETSSYIRNMCKVKKIVFYGRFDRCIPLEFVDDILRNVHKLNEIGRNVVIYLDHVSVPYVKTEFVEVKRLTEIDKYLLCKKTLFNESAWLGDGKDKTSV